MEPYPVITFEVNLLSCGGTLLSRAEQETFARTKTIYLSTGLHGDENILARHGDRFTLFGEQAVHFRQLIQNGVVQNVRVTDPAQGVGTVFDAGVLGAGAILAGMSNSSSRYLQSISGRGLLASGITDSSVTSSMVFQDDFDRTNSSAGGVGNGWSDPDSVWQISSSKLSSSSGGFFTHPLVRDLGIPYSDGRNYLVRWTVTYNGTVSPFLWVRASADGTQGLPAWFQNYSVQCGWQGSGDPGGGGSASMDASLAPASTLTAFDVLLFVCGDVTALASTEVGSDTPYLAAGYDPQSQKNNDGSPIGTAPDRTGPYYTNTRIVAGPFSTPNTLDDLRVSARTPDRAVICLGDSITCYGWPTAVQTFLGLRYSVRNLGVPSRLLQQMAVDWTTTNWTADSIAAAKAVGRHVTLVIAGGTNDLADNASAATTRSRLEVLIGLANAAGVDKIVVCTQLRREAGLSNGQNTAGFAAAVAAYNAGLLANAATLGITIADWASDSRIWATQSGDLVHPNRLGEFYLGQDTAPAIAF